MQTQCRMYGLQNDRAAEEKTTEKNINYKQLLDKHKIQLKVYIQVMDMKSESRTLMVPP